MKPPLACENCRERKKKCDRAYPICSYCLRTHGRCSYRVARSVTHPQAVPSSVVRVAPFSVMPHAAVFLDYLSFQEAQSRLPVIDFPVSPELREYVLQDDQMQEWIGNFIAIFDAWMPFIPREELRTQLPDLSRRIDGADVLLLACIKNLTQLPLEDSPCTKLYVAIKSAFLSAELSGAITLRLLQALVLLLFYEFGHGVYPGAYTTLGTCTRYLTVLGVDNAAQGPSEQDSWLEAETKRRLWWAVFVIERYMALGCPQRPLSLREPNETDLLPSDRISWDQGAPSTQSRCTLMSPATPNMGYFRLLVHAAYLLSKVLAYKADDKSDGPEGSQQLYCTILAFLNVLDVESRCNIMTVSGPRSLLMSAIFLLYPATSEENRLANVELKQSPRHLAASCFLRNCRVFLQGGFGPSDNASPFLCCWGFHSFQYYYALYQHDGRPETQKAIEDMTTSLAALTDRWKLMDVYMHISNARQTASVA